jgi:alpha-ketoglutarate-dependent taurine dioxygenase
VAFGFVVQGGIGEILAVVRSVSFRPPGGNTEFADMRAAYDALDPEIKAEIEDLITEHSLLFSRGQLGFHGFQRGGTR